MNSEVKCPTCSSMQTQASPVIVDRGSGKPINPRSSFIFAAVLLAGFGLCLAAGVGMRKFGAFWFYAGMGIFFLAPAAWLVIRALRGIPSTLFECAGCGYLWTAREEELTVRCPKCGKTEFSTKNCVINPNGEKQYLNAGEQYGIVGGTLLLLLGAGLVWAGIVTWQARSLVSGSSTLWLVLPFGGLGMIGSVLRGIAAYFRDRDKPRLMEYKCTACANEWEIRLPGKAKTSITSQ